MIGIYAVKNNINGMMYIGQSKNIKQRWYRHRGSHTEKTILSREMDKYGNIDSDSNNDFDCLNLDDFLIEKDFNHKIFLQLGQIFVDYKTEK